MESIGSIHSVLLHHGRDMSLAALAHGDVGRRVDRVLRAHTSAHPTRRSPLSRRLVFWLVLAMSLHRSRSVPNVFARLIADWSPLFGRLRGRGLGDDALAHARARLGPEPLRAFFESTAERVQPPATFHGCRVWAVDGVRTTLPDTPANEAVFGRPPAKTRSGFPQLHLVTLTAVHTHEIRAARWSKVPPNERELARDLLSELGENDLLLLDRGFYAAWFVQEVMERGCRFLARLQSNVKPRILAERCPGDYDVAIRPSAAARRPAGTPPRTLYLRMIVYRIGTEQVVLLTDLVDPSITKEELVALYHERWEVETSYDEIKTHLATVCHGALHTHFRGRSPSMVEQELWAMLAVYNLLRATMRSAAERAGLPPREISFVSSLEVIQLYGPRAARAKEEGRPHLLELLLADIAACVIDRPRRPRRAPRVKKHRAMRYGHKKPTDRSRPYVPLEGLEWRRAPGLGDP